MDMTRTQVREFLDKVEDWAKDKAFEYMISLDRSGEWSVPQDARFSSYVGETMAANWGLIEFSETSPMGMGFSYVKITAKGREFMKASR